MWGYRGFIKTFLVALISLSGLLLLGQTAAAYEYEFAGQFRALSPNAGGAAVYGASFKYHWLEATAAYNTALGFVGGASYRIDINEDSFFVPHINIGLPMFGPGFNLRLVKLFGAHLGVRFDSYAFLYIPSLQIEPLLILGASLAF